MNHIEAMRRQAAKDAKRYSEAQLNYGKGAGTTRRLLKAELEEKFKNEVYKTAFEAALARIDQAGVAEKIRKKKGVQAAVEGGRKTLRAARRAEGFYYRNQGWLGPLLRSIFR